MYLLEAAQNDIFFFKKNSDESCSDPSRQLNITGLHFASCRLAFFSPFNPCTCAIVSSSSAAEAAAAAQGSDSHDAPRLFVLPCGSSARLCLAPLVPLGSLPQRQGLAPCDCLFSRPRSLALSFLSNSHRAPPFIFLLPASTPLALLPCRQLAPQSSVRPCSADASLLDAYFSFSSKCFLLFCSLSSVFHLHVLRPPHPVRLPLFTSTLTTRTLAILRPSYRG